MRGGLRDERGVFLILWALLLTALLTMVAIVIDLGAVRDSRRQAQRTADLAAVAAAEKLAKGNVIEACRAAVDFIRDNSSLATLSETCATDFTPTCDPTPPAKSMTATAGDFEIQIQNPVYDDEIEDRHYAIDPATGKQIVQADGLPCERMRVFVQERNQALFAGVLGVSSLTSRAAAIGRGFMQFSGEDVPALLLLELEACGVLQTSGQGFVLVKGSGTKPGLIAVSSAASTTPGGCTNNNNADGKAVYGTEVPPSNVLRPNRPSIEALEAEVADPATGLKRPPILSVFAMNTMNSGRSAYIVPTGVKPDPEGGPRFTRDPVDERYGAAIASLRATAASPPGIFVNLSGILGPSCRVTTANNIIAVPRVHIDCDPKFTGAADEIVFTGTDFVTSVNVSVPSGKTWTFSEPKLVVVNRDAINKPAVGIQGRLNMNTGNTTPGVSLASDHCGPNRNGPGFSTTRFVVNDGEFEVAGSALGVKLCQTTLYMADGAASPRPDNENNTDKGTVTFGGGETDWTAPDQSEDPACVPPAVVPPGCYDSTATQYQVEDLALWSESARLSSVGGSGTIFLTGIFFLPNATFEFDGDFIQNIDRNAQFVARKLDMSGKGALILRPNPNEAITVQRVVTKLIR